MHSIFAGFFWFLAIAYILTPASAIAQPATPSEQGDRTISGVVASSTRNTLVVRAENNQFYLFVFDRDTEKPGSIPAGSRVSVVSTASDEPGSRLARIVTILGKPNASVQQGTAPAAAEPVPPAVRQLERDIERQARRWRLGVRAGAALDPELFLFGVHTQMGPFFNRDIWFRPNAEFAFGEVTTLIGLNLEAFYRLPISPRQGRWSAYIGAGPGFNFIHQNFERRGGDRDIDFGDFDYKTGFNILTGVQFRRGTFFELKSSIYSEPAPSLRLILGYSF